MAINPDLEKLCKTVEIENHKIVELMHEKIDWLVDHNLASLHNFKRINSHHLIVAELVINDLLLEIRNLKHSNENLTSMLNAKVQKES